jgi:hypothetical protein
VTTAGQPIGLDGFPRIPDVISIVGYLDDVRIVPGGTVLATRADSA